MRYGCAGLRWVAKVDDGNAELPTRRAWRKPSANLTGSAPDIGADNA